MTRRIIVFKNPEDGSFHATPEFNGDKTEFELFYGKQNDSGDGCSKDFVDILKEHFAEVSTLTEFKTANEYAQQEYRSFLGDPEILPVCKVSDVSALVADEIYILTPQSRESEYLDYLQRNPENTISLKEYSRLILDECVKKKGNVTYSNVYFRIKSEYVYDHGLPEEKKQSFSEEIVSLFEASGWTVEIPARDCISPTARKGKQSLYLHPMNFSGACLNCEIDTIEKMLSTAKTFSLRATDVYGEVFDMTDDEFSEFLDEKRDAIANDVLNVFKTKRSNLYVIDLYTALKSAWKKYDIKRLDRNNYDNEKILSAFVQPIFDELLKEGRIVSCNTKHGLGYKTFLSEKERKPA